MVTKELMYAMVVMGVISVTVGVFSGITLLTYVGVGIGALSIAMLPAIKKD